MVIPAELQVSFPIAYLLLFIGFCYSGEFSDVGLQIEQWTGWVWDALFQPLLNKVS
jgi:hypothetical protein